MISAIVLYIIYFEYKYTLRIHFYTLSIFFQENNLQFTDTPVVVGVYYEALCPDSKHFVIKQLLPSYITAPYLISIKLIPYGKATTFINNDGSLSFQCQHGKIECDANIVHACVIDIIKDPEIKLNVVGCMIKDNLLPLSALKSVSF